ncbi:CVNH domain-containing protein [Macrophomina phaseolina]|uniref:CVNH domain-containing protein n=1 Tax=Macrophomina phaseolina TaxID=35725 RepID=A0ABQ8G7S1_9PEZI|nr:CVNH domain-containing protein [Macrophomina phaseolina]
MSFTKTSRSISVTSDFLLTAECQAIGGEWKRSFLQLDKALGNADGEFRVESQDFSRSASDVVLKEENGSTILHARLRRRDQSWRKASFNLDAIVANRNGVLCVDTSYTRPPSEAVTCSSLEKLVADCRQTADDLKKQVYDQLAQEASAASQSVSTAFKGIQQMQEVLSDGGAYAYNQHFQQESEHLRFLLRDAVSQWSRMEDAMGAASQKVKEFQDADLQSVTAEIEAAEKRIAEEVYAAKLKQKEARDHLETLCKQIGQHQEEHKNALDQRHDAWARTVGFSIASVVVPFVFIPLAVY